MEERRRYSRKKCKSQIFLTDKDGLFLCTMDDISVGGARIHLNDRILQDDHLTFFVDEGTPFIARGKVAWNGDWTIGIEFMRSSDGDKMIMGPSDTP